MYKQILKMCEGAGPWDAAGVDWHISDNLLKLERPVNFIHRLKVINRMGQRVNTLC